MVEKVFIILLEAEIRERRSVECRRESTRATAPLAGVLGMPPRMLFPLPFWKGYRGMVRWVAEHECVPGTGQTFMMRFPAARYEA